MIPLGIAMTLGTTALHAEWKVATVRMSEVFNYCPEVISYGEAVKRKKQSIAEDVRYQTLLQKRDEQKLLNLEGDKLLKAYQKLKVKDEKSPEADLVREHTKKVRRLDSELKSLELEFADFQKEQVALINQEMAHTYRKILIRLTSAVQRHAAAKGYDVVYDVSGHSHMGLPTLLYVKPGITTDITSDLKKMIDAGDIK
jgi:Skp family chaperone for outer membrane proteins